MVTKEQNTDRVMDALGHKTRRDILALLRQAPLPVGGIAEQMPISRPAVSKHLRILQDAGLVEYTSVGTRNVFRLSTKGFNAARTYVESFWDQALAGFKSVAEGLEEAGT
jgi:DNA-binding transcriptional ArsR family regulator